MPSFERPHRPRRVVVPSTLVLCALAAFGCGGEAAPQSQQGGGAGRGRGGGDQALPVTVAQVVQKRMPIDIRVIGTAEAYQVVSVHAQITGQLTAVNFKEGEDVSKGQVLFALDRRPLESALLQAEANLQRDIAQAANARQQAQRYQDLADRGIATKEQLDTSRSGATAMEATVEADRAAVANARVQLQYATIAAPISGRTGALMVHEGNLVRANDVTPLVVINQVSPIYVSFGMPEARLPELKRYMARGSLGVEARPPTENGPNSHGHITFVDNNVDQTTGTIRIKGTFPNADRLLWPGQFVNVIVALTDDPHAIVVPSAAVQASQQGTYAYVVKSDRTVEFRTVVVERIIGDETVVREGLKPGETVVTDGHLRLIPGSRISIKGTDVPKVTS
jgi:multidrug efflux system membrane fusion protein